MSDKLANRPSNTALERPSYIKEGDVRGTENISTADIKPPALRLAQATSPEVKRSEADRYLEGLTEGQFFNSLTRQIYGEGPIRLIVVTPLGHRHVEFDKDGNVVDFNVKDGDPRTEWSETEVDGVAQRVKPRATKFYDYLCLVEQPDGGHQLMTFSLKSTQLKKAVQLNTIFKLSKLPTFAHLITVTAVVERGGGKVWYGWKFSPAGYPDEALYNEASARYDSIITGGKTVVVDREEVDTTKAADDIPF